MTDISKIDMNRINGLISLLESIDYVVESKEPTEEDQNWYRLYKSGWLEQGGAYKVTLATNGNGQVNFLKPFADTLYTIMVSARFETRTDSTGENAMGAYAESTDFFTVLNDGAVSNNKGVFWYACGQGA